MKRVRVRMTADGREGELHPMYDLLANAPFVDRVSTTHWNFSGERLGVMHYVEGDIDRFRAAVEAIDEVIEHELTPVDGDSFYAYVRSRTDAATDLFATLTRGELVVVHPVEWDTEGVVSISLLGDDAAVQAAVDGVPDPVRVAVREVGGMAGATGKKALLSDRQREAAEAAVERGYYDVPREASHEDVAAAIGCAPSTAAEHLRKAESRVMRSVVDGAER